MGTFLARCRSVVVVALRYREWLGIPYEFVSQIDAGSALLMLSTAERRAAYQELLRAEAEVREAEGNPEAKVLEVCAHSMRGLHATLAIEAGASPDVVARSLGHESASMTLSAYAAPGSAESANASRVQDLLANPAKEPATVAQPLTPVAQPRSQA